MEMLKMDEPTKQLLDATSIFTAIGSLLSWLPHIASLFTIIWLGIRVYETKTVQEALGKRKSAKRKQEIQDARRK